MRIQTSSSFPPLGVTTSVPRSPSAHAVEVVVGAFVSTSSRLPTVTLVPEMLAHGSSVEIASDTSVGVRHA
jgi:hypothetical protein